GDRRALRHKNGSAIEARSAGAPARLFTGAQRSPGLLGAVGPSGNAIESCPAGALVPAATRNCVDDSRGDSAGDSPAFRSFRDDDEWPSDHFDRQARVGSNILKIRKAP